MFSLRKHVKAATNRTLRSMWKIMFIHLIYQQLTFVSVYFGRLSFAEQKEVLNAYIVWCKDINTNVPLYFKCQNGRCKCVWSDPIWVRKILWSIKFTSITRGYIIFIDSKLSLLHEHKIICDLTDCIPILLAKQLCEIWSDRQVWILLS